MWDEHVGTYQATMNNWPSAIHVLIRLITAPFALVSRRHVEVFYDNMSRPYTAIFIPKTIEKTVLLYITGNSRPEWRGESFKRSNSLPANFYKH